ncbi:hypothetical protein J7E43_19760 [Bacillus sp. ISL-8]|uniref:Uncharacterized protein n=1 Tax=Bacillus mycoides TaxID=1405 RepID=A0A1W6AA51_BACMY|nr:hypothetical protein [Bacillus mycoides]ARJ22702.1 hypothetical protein B7492_16460 [Bacillus mycoides]MBT2579607.1 hypothetical protein [Bacillus sp. ISL-8]
MLLTKKRFVISSSFIVIASLCAITLLTKPNTKLASSPSSIEKETIILSSGNKEEFQTFHSSSFNNTHTFRGGMGTGFDFSGLGDLKVTVENTGTNAFTYSIKSKDEEKLVRHTIKPNEGKTFTLRSLVTSPEPGYYYLSAYNEDGSESSMRLEVQPE